MASTRWAAILSFVGIWHGRNLRCHRHKSWTTAASGWQRIKFLCKAWAADVQGQSNVRSSGTGTSSIVATVTMIIYARTSKLVVSSYRTVKLCTLCSTSVNYGLMTWKFFKVVTKESPFVRRSSGFELLVWRWSWLVQQLEGFWCPRNR